MSRDRSTLPESVRTDLLRAYWEPSDDAAATVTTHLHGTDPRGRVLALRAADRHGWIDASGWRACLADEDADVRRDAARLLARRPADELDDVLIDTLGDEDALVVDAAAFALGERGVTHAVPALIAVARHDDARCRESAVSALGVIGDDRARATLIAALADKAPVRRRAVVALANFEGPDIESALALARDDKDWQVRAAVDQLERGPLADDN